MANETENQFAAPDYAAPGNEQSQVHETAPDYYDPPPQAMGMPADRADDTHGVDLVSVTSQLPPDAFDRLGAAMASAVQQTAGLKSIRVAGGENSRRSRYAPAVHSFVAQLQAELQQLFDE